MTIDRRVESARQALRVAFGVVPFLAGLDKFFNLLAEWPRYLSPAAEAILPVSGQVFMYFAGAIEMVVGIAILTRWPVLGSYVASAWLVAIAANLVATGAFLDVAARDLVLATAAYSLARLSEVHATARDAAARPIAEAEQASRLGAVA